MAIMAVEAYWAALFKTGITEERQSYFLSYRRR